MVYFNPSKKPNQIIHLNAMHLWSLELGRSFFDFTIKFLFSQWTSHILKQSDLTA